MEYRDELAIAEKAEKMLTSALRNKTQSFKEHYYRKEDAKSLKEAFAKAKTKKYGRKKDGNQKVFLRALTIQMAKHGFVQHYGVDTIRKGGERNRTRPRSISYFYKEHDFDMKATPFINDAVKQSGVIDFVSKSVAEIRAKTFGNQGLITQEQYHKGLQQIEEETDNKKREIARRQAKAQRIQALAQIAVNTAQAIMSTNKFSS